jgi:hypothetical protein
VTTAAVRYSRGRGRRVRITDEETGSVETIDIPVQGYEVRLPVVNDFPLKRIVCSEECMWEWDRKHWLP